MTLGTLSLKAVLIVVILAVPLAADSQSARKIGFLSVSPPPRAAGTYPYLEGFRQGLRERGWVEGQNLIIEYRWGADRPESAGELARELLRLNVDVIVTYGNQPPHALKDVVKTVPIVALSCDPLETIVTSLARPSGNITGTTCMSSELTPKKLELLLEAVPSARRLAMLYNSADPGPRLGVKLAQEVAMRRQLKLQTIAVTTPDEFPGALAAIGSFHPDALYVYPDPLTARFARATIDFAAREHVPTMYGFRQWPEAGGLMSYGSIIRDLGYRGAGQADKILKGAKPVDVPIDQATTFELVINLKTAKALGLTIPPSLLLRADQVIE
jgi:putative ABC transport system substrate-binding protein